MKNDIHIAEKKEQCKKKLQVPHYGATHWLQSCYFLTHLLLDPQIRISTCMLKSTWVFSQIKELGSLNIFMGFAHFRYMYFEFCAVYPMTGHVHK